MRNERETDGYQAQTLIQTWLLLCMDWGGQIKVFERHTKYSSSDGCYAGLLLVCLLVMIHACS
ncbi:hypothetical protein BS50DRAFT_570590 [Corynespora cassiicola Philippines]|uniref:Uncharacterized protein n=1 Tax=Corynespora cassiicola Philippines TaxID=1448308 RepID=A0A2T2P0N7_CORCC|nr:hypothetical protein BS50DRAFT_570590 [Corynespora cassiicola Philippines]